MLEGFWILQFTTPQFTGGGVAVLVRGMILGGDNGFTWIGTYSGDDRIVKGRVSVQNFDTSVQSILGVSGDYEMHFSGNVAANIITGTAIIAGQPQYSVGFRMTKKTNL
jgi:hypothetical protein